MTTTKIFCIGLNKTGTISLHQALETLGFRSLHWGGPEVAKKIHVAFHEGRPLVEDLDDYDAYSDLVPISKRFDVLDRQYPGSRFILTTRDMEGWIRSRTAHVLRNQERAERGEYTGTFLVVDPDAWRADFIEHHRRVAEYFEGRDDLLTMDITKGDGYELLCPFLAVPIPAEPFPHRHRTATA